MKKKSIEKYTFYSPEWDNYLDEVAQYVQTSRFLPKYHLYPKTGLMNDPNGLSYFNGKYHVFYQWFPFDAAHGMKHWGHATSDNLVSFEDQGYAIIPDEEYERHGAYSGNAFEYEGKLYLYYTANYKTDNGKIAKQALAVMDQTGKIEKYSGNPIIEGAPTGFSDELRDPFVFKRDGNFYMLLGGSRFADGQRRIGFGDIGEILLYKSDDLFHWEYLGTIDLPIDKGYMLECPSLTRIDGKDVLILSPMGVKREKYRFQNRFAAIYLIGKLDVKNRTFQVEMLDELDSGFDFYAPQTFYGRADQSLMIGWFGCGEQIYPTDDEMWKHGLTMSQNLSIHNNRLYRYPIEELTNSFELNQCKKVKELFPNTKHYHVSFDININENFELKVGSEDDYWVFSNQVETGLVSIHRGSLSAKIDEGYGQVRSIKAGDYFENNVTVDIFVDNSFVEVYLNKGERVFSFRVFLVNEKQIVKFSKQKKATLGNYRETHYVK
ncbi:glycoside hydrolase family 32 protein [Vagococcus vulneris]|uniref:glycoside hydrolase family 32 protein n=1 Tax=Vagococcus vulneris TaxID=1977869 RepID=UPI001403F0CB|nr:glycoside hydrolase family 32 protein [Vagococcus vulneris]